MSLKTVNRTACGLTLMALFGCTAAPPPPPPPPPVVQETAPTGPVALVPPPPAPPVKPPPPKRRDDRKAASPPATQTSPPVQLVGLDEGAVQALLGPPSAIEDHAPGKTWRFRRRECVLVVALYPDVQSRVFRTLSYEVTSDEHNAGAKQLCESKFGTVATAD